MSRNPLRTTYEHIVKYTGLLGGVQVFTILMSIIRNKCAAYFIGPWGLGLVDTYSKTADLVGNTTNFGIAFSAVRHLSELAKKGNRRALEIYVKLIRSWTLLTALLGLLVCIAFSPMLSMQLFQGYHATKGIILLSPTVMTLTLLGGLDHIREDVEREKKNIYYAVANLLMVSMLALIFTNDLFTAYVFIEINTITACGIIVSRDNRKANTEGESAERHKSDE